MRCGSDPYSNELVLRGTKNKKKESTGVILHVAFSISIMIIIIVILIFIIIYLF